MSKFKVGDYITIPDIPYTVGWGVGSGHNPGDIGEVIEINKYNNYLIKCNGHTYWYKEKNLVIYGNRYQPKLI